MLKLSTTPFLRANRRLLEHVHSWLLCIGQYLVHPVAKSLFKFLGAPTCRCMEIQNSQNKESISTELTWSFDSWSKTNDPGTRQGSGIWTYPVKNWLYLHTPVFSHGEAQSLRLTVYWSQLFILCLVTVVHEVCWLHCLTWIWRRSINMEKQWKCLTRI